MDKHLFLTILLTSVSLQQAQAAERISLSGTIDTTACTTVCGSCCTSLLIKDSSGEINLQVGNSVVDLSGISGDKSLHHFTGSFYQGAGQCNVGQCTLFMVEAVDQEPVPEATFNADTGLLTLPSVKINGSNAHFAVTLTPPFNINSIVELTKENLAQQGESCQDAGMQCNVGLSCLEYYGIAGASGPLFKTCEIPCTQPGASCPVGQSCVVIADGPGQVCQ